MTPYVADDRYWRVRPVERRAPGPRVRVMCGVAWCVAYADDLTGELREAREWAKDLDTGTTRIEVKWTPLQPRCKVHRKAPDYKPKRSRATLKRVWARVKPSRRRRAA